MQEDVGTLTQAIELVAAGSWAIESALRCLDAGDVARAAQVLHDARDTVREGLVGLRGVLAESVRDSLERPERLARAVASLEELRELTASAPRSDREEALRYAPPS